MILTMPSQFHVAIMGLHILSFLFFLFFSNGASTKTFSTIKLGDRLNSTDHMISASGNFSLKFYNDGDDKALLIIKDIHKWSVWVNQNDAFISTSSDHVLSINPNTGNLIITAGGIIVMNVTNVQAGPNANVTVSLEDNRNLRLINEIDKMVLWQSFDHPTDVLLPVIFQDASLAVSLFSHVHLPIAQSIVPIMSQLASSPTIRLGTEMTMKILESLNPSIMKQVIPLVEQPPPLYMEMANGREKFSPEPSRNSKTSMSIGYCCLHAYICA
ncbi:G-type lectin S-receptor-like serine/threonine-protein kinase [Tanacetum coccineum]